MHSGVADVAVFRVDTYPGWVCASQDAGEVRAWEHLPGTQSKGVAMQRFVKVVGCLHRRQIWIGESCFGDPGGIGR